MPAYVLHVSQQRSERCSGFSDLAVRLSQHNQTRDQQWLDMLITAPTKLLPLFYLARLVCELENYE